MRVSADRPALATLPIRQALLSAEIRRVPAIVPLWTLAFVWGVRSDSIVVLAMFFTAGLVVHLCAPV